MGYKLVRILKKIYLTSFLTIAFISNADDVEKKQNFNTQVINAKHDLSIHSKAKIYSIKANTNGLSLRSSKIDNPSLNSLRLYKDPSRNDKYILKILDENSKVIGLIGLKNPFYIHLQHIGYEDSNVFGGYVDYNFDIPISMNSNAKYISFHEQNEFGLKEISKIQLD